MTPLERFKLLGNEGKRIYDIVRTLHSGSGRRPRLLMLCDLADIELDRLHHLTHRAVGKYHRRHAVCIREIKRADGERRHLLNGRGSKDYHAEIAVSAAARSLEIIRLRGLYAAEPGASALYVDDERGSRQPAQ